MGKNIGIDLGTYKTNVYINGRGIIYSQPTAVAYKRETRNIVAIGQKAYDMIGRAPDEIKVIRPVSNGVVYDYNFTQKMLERVLKRIKYLGILKPRLAICVPSIVTDIERKAIVDIAINIGARCVFIIDEPVAAAIGENLDITKPKGRLVIDIGGGSSDIAILSLNGIVIKNSIRIAGDSFDEEIIRILKTKHDLLVGEVTARQIKETIGSLKNNRSLVVKGKNSVTGLPMKKEINGADFFDRFNVLADEIIDSVKSVIREAPPDILTDLNEELVLLTGGGAKLDGLKEKIESEIKLKVYLPESPEMSVSKGTGKCFKFHKILSEGFIKFSAYKK